MTARSLLFVPGDRPDRIQKALSSGADGLILDLEDSVAPAAKAKARACVAEALQGRRRGPALYVRINPIEAGALEGDLGAFASAAPDAIVLPKAEGARSVRDLTKMLPVAIPVLPIATETAAALFVLGSYAEVRTRLAGLTWGAEDLSAVVGAESARDERGRLTAPYELARSLTLFAAAAADVAPIETVYPAIRDLEGLGRYARRAARDGFVGMMAIHPSQVPVINEAFSISRERAQAAEALIAAFDANPGAGVLAVGGMMVDAPHLAQARRLVARAGRAR